MTRDEIIARVQALPAEAKIVCVVTHFPIEDDTGASEANSIHAFRNVDHWTAIGMMTDELDALRGR